MGIDATVVSPLHADGQPWARAADSDGVAIRRAEAAKRAAYPELVGSAVVRLVTVASEVGGRMSPETKGLLQQLAGARARTAPPMLQRAARAGWAWRWACHISIAVQGALAATLVDAVPVELDGADGVAPPVVEVCACI